MDILDKLGEKHGLTRDAGDHAVKALSTGWSLIDQLAHARAASGLTQTEVAQRMGTTQAAVAKLETHRHDPRLSTLMRYVAALGEHASPLLRRLEDYLHEDEVADYLQVEDRPAATETAWHTRDY